MKREDLNSNLMNRRIQNALRTSIFNVLNVVLLILGPFILRTLMLKFLGDEYVGLNSLFLSIISVLNMTELGFGTVIVYFLYDAVAKDDFERIGKYLNAIRSTYRKVGALVFFVGLIIIAVFPRFIHDEIIGNDEIRIAFFFLVLGTTIQYMLFPETVTLFSAYQRGDITAKINGIVNIFLYFFQGVAIGCFHSFVGYFLAICIQVVLAAIARQRYKEKLFPQIKIQGKISNREHKSITKRIMAVVGHQMDEKFLVSIDNITLSSFCGLSVVAAYGNYMYVVSALNMIFLSVMQSGLSGIGNSIVTEDKKANYAKFKMILWANGLMTCWASACMFCLYQNFMILWVGERLFDDGVVALFCIYFFVLQMRNAVLLFKNANGMWWDDRYKPYVSILVNLILDIALVKYIGVQGALISSICCILLIEVPWEAIVLFRNYFSCSLKYYILKQIEMCLVGTFCVWLSYMICNQLVPIHGISSLLIRFVLVTLCCCIVYIVIYARDNNFRMWIAQIRKIRQLETQKAEVRK